MKQSDLMQPIYDKLNASIAKVSKEKGYKLVVSIASVLYADESVNITEAVKADLGL